MDTVIPFSQQFLQWLGKFQEPDGRKVNSKNYSIFKGIRGGGGMFLGGTYH